MAISWLFHGENGRFWGLVMILPVFGLLFGTQFRKILCWVDHEDIHEECDQFVVGASEIPFSKQELC